jgi:MscS family membrane protein
LLLGPRRIADRPFLRAVASPAHKDEPMREWQRYFEISPDPSIWLAQVFLVVLLTVTVNFVLMRVLAAIERAAHRSASRWDDVLVDAARLPLRLCVWIVGLSAAIAILQEVRPSALMEVLPQARRVAFIVAITLFLTRAIKLTEQRLTDPKRVEKPVDETTARAAGKLLRLAVVITAVLVALQTLGYSISGVLAFGGIGGIAVGFAAKDLLANFFGGLMIYLDKPFAVGDWVRSPDRTIEGTVEDIGWRLTRIRTFDKRPLYVPNSLFANIAIENPSRMTQRRISENLGVRYEDGERLPRICERIREMLAAHPGIDPQASQMVHFTRYADSYLEFMVYCFTKTAAWAEFLRVKEEVLFKIMAIVEEEGAEFAFPTRTLHVASAPPEFEPRRSPAEPGRSGPPGAVADAQERR